MEKKQEFRRNITLTAGISLVAGSMIGSGIFIVSADIARTVGSPFYLLLVWLITGLLTIIAALSYGELAGMMPRAGGQYVYLREAYNPLMGFLYGWTFFLVIQTGTIAAVAVAFAKFTAVLFPVLSESNIVFQIHGFGISAAQLLAIASILLLTLINYFGIEYGKIIQIGFTITKVAALAGMIILGFIAATKSNFWDLNFADMWKASSSVVQAGGGGVTEKPLAGIALLSAIGVAMVGSLFSSDAWNSVTFIAGEMKDPRRNIPRSLFWGVIIVIILYLLTNTGYLMLLPLKGDPQASDVIGKGIQYATSDRVGVAAAFQIFGTSAASIMAVLIMIATFGCNNGLILSGARVYYIMAHDGLFFKKVDSLNRYSVPGLALIIQAVWASLLCLSGKYSDLLDYVIFAVLIFYILTIAGIFRLRKIRHDAERPYKAFGYPIFPALYIVVATLICIDLIIMKPGFTWPGFIIFLAGFPVYYLAARQKQI